MSVVFDTPPSQRTSPEFTCLRSGANPSFMPEMNSLPVSNKAPIVDAVHEDQEDEEPAHAHFRKSAWANIPLFRDQVVQHLYSDAFKQGDWCYGDDMKLSEYLEYHETCASGWGSVFSGCKKRIRDLQTSGYLKSLGWYVYPMQSHEAPVLVSKNASFVLFMTDFFLAYDEVRKAAFAIVPGSPLILLKDGDNSTFSLDGLIGRIAIQQVYFLARRLVQVTQATWKYGCLAQIEKELPLAKMLHLFDYTLNLFSGVEIDLFPLGYNCLAGCAVGVVDVDEELYHPGGIKILNSVIVFRRHKDGIANPEVDDKADFDEDVDWADGYDLTIGGEHSPVEPKPVSSPSFDINPKHASPAFGDLPCAMDVQIPVMPEIQPLAAVGRQLDVLQTLCIPPEQTQLTCVGDVPVFNLAFVPRNKHFNDLRQMSYGRKDLALLKQHFQELGYGERFAEALRCYAQAEVGRNGRITLVAAQHGLLNAWLRQSRTSMVPFSLTMHKRYLPKGEHFLLLSNGRLLIVQSTKRIAKSIVVGVSNFQLGLSVANDDVINKSTLTNILDGAEKVSGFDSGFDIYGRGRGFAPTPDGMQRILGGLTFVCALLHGRVRPEGRFMSCMLAAAEEVNQPVEMNIPMPAGVVFSTLAKAHAKQLYSTLIQGGVWNSRRDYELPFVAGNFDAKDEDTAEAYRSLRVCRRQ